MKLPRSRGRAPWAIASFLAIPLFFSSLMAATLALEKPRVVQWRGGKHGILTTWHQPSAATEARIWLWALLPPLLLSLVGFLCMRIPYGWYVACATAIVIAIAVVHDINKWTLHHTLRFPVGVDLIPKSNPTSNTYDAGEWERLARSTALSLQHWTIALAGVAIVLTAALNARRRLSRKPSRPPAPPVESMHAPDVTLPGLD